MKLWCYLMSLVICQTVEAKITFFCFHGLSLIIFLLKIWLFSFSCSLLLWLSFVVCLCLNFNLWSFHLLLLWFNTSKKTRYIKKRLWSEIFCFLLFLPLAVDIPKFYHWSPQIFLPIQILINLYVLTKIQILL